MKQVKIIESRVLNEFNDECNKFMANVNVLNFRMIPHEDKYIATIVYSTEEERRPYTNNYIRHAPYYGVGDYGFGGR